MFKPTHVEFLDSSQVSIYFDDNKNGLKNLYIECRLSAQQSELTKNVLQNCNILFINKDEIVLSPTKSATVYKNVKVIDGVGYLNEASIECDQKLEVLETATTSGISVKTHPDISEAKVLEMFDQVTKEIDTHLKKKTT